MAARFPEFFERVAERLQLEPSPPPRGQEPSGASWLFVDFPWGGDPAIPIDLAGDLEPDESGWATQGLGLDGLSGETVDAYPPYPPIAFYRPWHFAGENWGIYFFADRLVDFTQGLAVDCRALPYEVAPFAFHQVLRHELVHFAFEVAGTEVEDVLGEGRYCEYMLLRFRRPLTWTSGPAEEAIAEYHEVTYSRRSSGLPSPPKGYYKAVRANASASPPGYRDWHRVQPDPDQATADVVALIADRPIVTGRWGPPLRPGERAQVPLYWIGDPALLRLFGVAKEAGTITIRAFEAWARAMGATIDPSRGAGSHRRVTYRGHSTFYGTSQKRLGREVQKKVARLFDLANGHELYLAIQDA